VLIFLIFAVFLSIAYITLNKLFAVFSARQHICYSALYAIARPSVRLSVCLSVCHTGGSVKDV